MKKISNIDDFLDYTKSYQKIHTLHSIQCDINDRKQHKDFISYLCNISDYIYTDEIDIYSSFRRVKSDLGHEELINKITSENSDKCGIKINNTPYFSMFEWETWENGYVEGFISIKEKRKNYFIWTYVKMIHIKEILNKWKDYLVYFD